MILTRDMAPPRTQIQRGDIMRPVPPLEFNGFGARGEGEELVAETDAHDGEGRGGSGHEGAEGEDGVGAVGGVAGAVGDEDAVEVAGDFVDRVVEGEAGDACAAVGEGAEDVFLDAAVENGDVEGAAVAVFTWGGVMGG